MNAKGLIEEEFKSVLMFVGGSCFCPEDGCNDGTGKVVLEEGDDESISSSTVEGITLELRFCVVSVVGIGEDITGRTAVGG